MQPEPLDIEPYAPTDRAQALEVALRAWRPVFEQMRAAVPSFVYDNFYPQGWEARQILDLGTVLDDDPESVTVAKWLTSWSGGSASGSTQKTIWGKSTCYVFPLNISGRVLGGS